MSKGLDYTLNMDNSGFTTGVSGAQSSLGGFQSFSTGALAAVGAAVAAVAMAAKGLSMAWGEVKASIGEAADRETMETAFIPLLGSAKAARERMAELAEFANKTPFQLPGIAAASRTLETLTDGALATGAGLTLVGDVASGVNQPIDEMANTIGRLYAGLDSGRPVGEAMQRLGELGIITPGVRSKLEALQAEGKKGSEVWQIAADDMARFSGGMELQSKTWNGKISTLADAWATLRAEFGTPIMDALKPLLTEGIGTVEAMVAKAKEIGETIAFGIRFMVEAFKQGEAWDLARLGLTLAFQESVNFLWKTLMGVWEAFPVYIVEGFKTGVEFLKILTEASFWRLVGDAFLGVMQAAVGGIMAILSELTAKILDLIPGMEDQAQWMHGLAGEFKDGASKDLSKSGDAAKQLVDSYGERILGRFSDQFSAIGVAFADGFGGAADLIDTSGIRSEMTATSDKIVTALNAQDAAKKAADDEDVVKGKPQRKEDEAAPRVKINWESVLAGSLAKVGGGGYGHLMLSAENIPAKQLSETKKTNDLLDKLLKKAENGKIILA